MQSVTLVLSSLMVVVTGMTSLGSDLVNGLILFQFHDLASLFGLSQVNVKAGAVIGVMTSLSATLLTALNYVFSEFVLSTKWFHLSLSLSLISLSLSHYFSPFTP